MNQMENESSGFGQSFVNVSGGNNKAGESIDELDNLDNQSIKVNSNPAMNFSYRVLHATLMTRASSNRFICKTLSTAV